MKGKRIGLIFTTAAAILAIVVAVVVADTGLVAQDIGFEIEGNLAYNGVLTDSELDWTGEGHNPGYPPAILIVDEHSKAAEDQSVFRPAGKFDQPENWIVQPSSVGPGQNELTNIFAWAVPPGSVGNTDAWIVMGMERTKKEGTFALDFEFNQNTWTDPYSGGPVRAPGDLMVGFELKGNPSDPEEDMWVLIAEFMPDDLNQCAVTKGKGSAPDIIQIGTDPCPAYGDTGWVYRYQATAAILNESGLGVATMNSQGFAQLPFTAGVSSYVSLDTKGVQDDYVGEFEFAEAAINLFDFGLDPGCPGFGSVHAKSRSSLEVGSDLKDLAWPTFLPVQCYIEGHKFLDTNGNGAWDDGEEALSGWEIQLSGTASGTTFTDENGYYIFEDIVYGDYVVAEVCPEGEGWVQTAPGFSVCGDIAYDPITINAGNMKVSDIDFGNGQPDIDISKTCPADVFVGDEILYEIVVENTGSTVLFNVHVTDINLGLDDTIDVLEVGETKTYEPTYTPAVTGERVNTAGVSGQYPEGASFFTVDAVTEECVTTVWELNVTKTAETFFDRTFEWEIEKLVDPAAWALFDGESGTSDYTVTVTRTGYYDENFQVKGDITLSNPAPIAADLSGVVDEIDLFGLVEVDCPSLVIPAEDSLTCTYDTGKQGAVDTNPFGDLNTATATQLLYTRGVDSSELSGNDKDYSGTAAVDFTSATITEFDNSITVSDTSLEFGGDKVVVGPADDDAAYYTELTYDIQFVCAEENGQEFNDGGYLFTYDNIASFITPDKEVYGEDDASVDVACYYLNVDKTVDEFFRRYYDWEISKDVDVDSWDLFAGESATSNFTVFLDQLGYEDNDWLVSGTITISNPAPMPANLNGVVDEIDAYAGDVNVECPALIVPAGGSLECSYTTGEQDSPDANPFALSAFNTASAEQQLNDYASDGTPTPGGTKDYLSDPVAVDFSDVDPELVDEDATLVDVVTSGDYDEVFMGPETVSDDLTWEYPIDFVCPADKDLYYDAFGNYVGYQIVRDNTARFITYDTPLSGEDSESVVVNCYLLEVDKTANTYFTRTYEWDITKVVDEPGPVQVFRGDSITVEYTVEVDVIGQTDSDYGVYGVITVVNNAPIAASISGVEDLLDNDFAVDVNCGTDGPWTIPAKVDGVPGVLECSYDTGTQASHPGWTFNLAKVTQSLDGGGELLYGATADVDFSNPALMYEINEEIEVTDTYAGFLGTANVLEDDLPKQFVYERTITAPEDYCGLLQVDNTATFETLDIYTTGSDEARVLVDVPCEGCTPGFWQGGNGSQLWNVANDPDWNGNGTNPYFHSLAFNDYFAAYGPVGDLTMYNLVSTGGGEEAWRKAARDVVAAYLNASWGMVFPYTASEIADLWSAAVADGSYDAFMEVHGLLAPANDPDMNGGYGYCPIP